MLRGQMEGGNLLRKTQAHAEMQAHKILLYLPIHICMHAYLNMCVHENSQTLIDHTFSGTQCSECTHVSCLCY